MKFNVLASLAIDNQLSKKKFFFYTTAVAEVSLSATNEVISESVGGVPVFVTLTGQIQKEFTVTVATQMSSGRNSVD